MKIGNSHPTDLLTTLEPQNPTIGELYVFWKRQVTDFGAPTILGNNWSDKPPNFADWHFTVWK